MNDERGTEVGNEEGEWVMKHHFRVLSPAITSLVISKV
jgi:hypothetical protein